MLRTRFLKAGISLLVGALLSVGLLAANPAAALAGAVAAPTEETAFAAAINQVRAVHGLAPLRLDPELSAIARAWSFEMAAAGQISHRRDLAAGVTSDWTSLGENVGEGPGVTELMTAFVNSPGHFKNLVDPRFNYMGVGAVVVNGLIFTTHEFMNIGGAAPVAPPTTVRAQTSAPRPAPAVTTARPTPAPAAPARASAPRAAATRSPAPAPAAAPAAAATPAAPRPAATPSARVLEVLDRLRGDPPQL